MNACKTKSRPYRLRRWTLVVGAVVILLTWAKLFHLPEEEPSGPAVPWGEASPDAGFVDDEDGDFWGAFDPDLEDDEDGLALWGSTNLAGPGAAKRGPADYPGGGVDGFAFRFFGNRSFADDTLVSVLDLSGELPSDQVERLVRRQILGFYRAQGFARAALEGVSCFGEAPRTVDVVIREGDIYYLGEVRFSGLESIPALEARALYPPSGEPADRLTLRRADRRLMSLYLEGGFTGVRIVPTAILPRDSNRFEYRLRIEEGPRYRLRNISFPPALASRFPLRSGDVFRPRVLDQFLEWEGIPREALVVGRNNREGWVDLSLAGGNDG